MTRARGRPRKPHSRRVGRDRLRAQWRIATRKHHAKVKATRQDADTAVRAGVGAGGGSAQSPASQPVADRL